MFFSRRDALKSVLAAATSGGFLNAAAQSGSTVRLGMIEGLSGALANGGEAVFRNLVWAIERINARGGIKATSGANRMLELRRYDNKGQVEEALSAFRAALDDGVQIILQGNSSAVAAALIDAVNKHNEREPNRRVVYLNYSAVDPALTNERCSPWHFRFDAHADMRMTALMSVLKDDAAVKSVYLIGQDYSFGQAVLREAKRQLPLTRADIAIAGEELHPLARIKDFAPYAAKIKASGADALITGNWSNDLTLLVKACREVGFEGKFYTFYGNALGVPAALGDAGVGKVIAVADWLPNVPTRESEAFYKSFRERFPKPADDYVHMRLHLMMEALAQSLQNRVSVDSVDVAAVANTLSGVTLQLHGQRGFMRAADGQFQQSLVVGVMDKQGTPGVQFDVEGTGYGFRVLKQITPQQAQMAHNCKMAAR
jgi:branched-chain amino acid transport system substrate-binding protein